MRYASRIIGIHKGIIVFNDEPSKLTDSMIELIYGTSIDQLSMTRNQEVGAHA